MPTRRRRVGGISIRNQHSTPSLRRRWRTAATFGAASANLLQTRSILSEARGELWPTTSLSAGASDGSTIQDQIAAASGGTDNIRTGPRFDLGTDISWELDLFGRLRSTVKAAKADSQASAALEDGIRVAVAAGVTGAWLDACGYAHQADVARQSLELARRGRDVAERLRAAGSGLPVDVLRADALAAQASAAIPMLDAKRHDALAELAVLIGRPPTEIPPAAAACRQLPSITAVLPIGDGLALLRRRPDVRAAEQKLAANTARIGVAVADLYPRISLDGGAAYRLPRSEELLAATILFARRSIVELELPQHQRRPRARKVRPCW